jgi:transcriptional regulator with XRE-family HTH domain
MPRRKVPHPVAAAIGARVRVLRKERGLSLGKLAAASAVPKGSLSSLERGLVLIRLPTAVAIARGLEVDPAQLFTFPEEGEIEKVVDLLYRLPEASAREVIAKVERARRGLDG